MEDSDRKDDRDHDRAKYLFLSLLQARVGSSLVARLGDLAPEALFETPFPDLANWGRISGKAARAFDELQRDFDAHAIKARLDARGIRVVTVADDDYPGKLRNLPDPPPALYLQGRVPETVSVALVGSRKASATGLETARALGRALSERGVCVVSGLALGVDAAAHREPSKGEARRLAYSDAVSMLRIPQNTNGFGVRFRARLSEGRAPRLDLTRA